MKRINEEIIDSMDAMIYSGEELSTNIESMVYLRKTLKRWINKIEVNINYANAYICPICDDELDDCYNCQGLGVILQK